MIKYQLIKTNNSLILVSDEEIKEKNNFIRLDTGIIFSSLIGSNPHIIKKYCKKVLSQSPKLSKEVADEIGWIDVEEIFESYFHKLNQQNIYEDNYKNKDKSKRDYLAGYQQKANELNQKKYTEKDFKKIIHWASLDEDVRLSEEDMFKSLFQNQWQVEAQEIDGVWNVTKIL